MLFPIIGVKLHGWLDELVVAIYLVGAALIPLRGPALAVGLGGAAVHFLLTRLTDYPRGTFKRIPFRVHAFIELGEGLAVAAGAGLVRSSAPRAAVGFLVLMGLSQLGAFSFSDYGRAPKPDAQRGGSA